MEKLKVISLGAGVQSTTLYLMSCLGELEKVDFAIFADPQWELPSTYENLDWLEENFDIPIIRVSAGDIREHEMRGKTRGENWLSMPFWYKTDKGHTRLKRQCTSNFKMRPIYTELRYQLGQKTKRNRDSKTGRFCAIPEGAIELWLGISIDEVLRMKPSRKKWITNRWPLLEKKMSRTDCIDWLAKNNFPCPSRSSCTGCPYRSKKDWLMIQQQEEVWRDVTEFDKAIRTKDENSELFIHPYMVPLTEVPYLKEEEDDEPDHFNNECEGFCGL